MDTQVKCDPSIIETPRACLPPPSCIPHASPCLSLRACPPFSPLPPGVTRPNRPGINVELEPPAVKLNDALGGLLTYKLAGEDCVRSSGVPYCIVRPTALTEEPLGAPLEIDQGDVIKVWGGLGFRWGVCGWGSGGRVAEVHQGPCGRGSLGFIWVRGSLSRVHVGQR